MLRAAGAITGERPFVIIGSQSLQAKHPDLPDELHLSVEVDRFAKNDPTKTERLNEIGVDSLFHEQFGDYADPVDERTAVLPRGWKGRLVHLPPGESAGIEALCLDPHDLGHRQVRRTSRKGHRVHTCDGKAGRRAPRATLVALLATALINDQHKALIRQYIDQDFRSANP